jgi:DNA-binding XRE family transcriptional regulator
MFEFEGFGRRLQQLRKEKGMTQEELANRLGVTGQAVSKWENGQSYPDITSIPTISTVLGTEIDFLFGKRESKTDAKFPPVYEGLPFVHSFQNVACYSAKTAAAAEGSGVRFADGSTAELSSRLVNNEGVGEIRLLAADDFDPQIDMAVTSKELEFGPVDSVDVEVFYNRSEIIRSSDGKSRVRAKGDARFIAMLNARADDGTLSVRFDEKEGYDGPAGSNSVTIEIPRETGRSASVQINKTGTLVSEVNHFDNGDLQVNGAGSVTMKGFGRCRAAINGSGTITAIDAGEANLSVNGSGCLSWENIRRAAVTINGSGDAYVGCAVSFGATVNGAGDVTLKLLNGQAGDGDFSVNINGSGNVCVGGGSCQTFDAIISGAGEIDASGVTARRASIVIAKEGNVTLGRVTERSTEQIKRKGTIHILQRGNP